MPRTTSLCFSYNSAKRFSSTDFPQIYTCSNPRRRSGITKDAKYSTTGTSISFTYNRYLTGIQAILGNTTHPGNTTNSPSPCYLTTIVTLRDFTTRISSNLTANTANICFAVYCISNTPTVLNIYFFCPSHNCSNKFFSVNIRILNCNIFYGTINIMSCASSKQTDTIQCTTYFHSRHSMVIAVKIPFKRLPSVSYWCPFLIVKIKIIFQNNIFSIVPVSGIHIFCKIRKFRRCLNLKWIILCTLSRGKPICNRCTIPGIYCFSFRSRTHRHSDPHQCRQCQQGQPHLHAPCFCTFLHNPHAFLYPAKFHIFPNPLQM